MWPVSGSPSGWPVSRVPQPHRGVGAGGGQRCPSGAERHPRTAPVWPVRGAPIGWPVAGSHSRTVGSCAGGGQRCPSGANATADHRAGVAGEGGADRLAGVAGPTAAPSGRRWRRPAVPVRGERHTAHRAGVAGEGVRRAAGRWRGPTAAPSASLLAVASGCPSGLNATAVTAPVWPVSGAPSGWPVCGVPQPHRAVGAGGGQRCPSGANATPVTAPVWPVSGGRAGVRSRPTAAPSGRRWRWPAGCPSGANATPFTPSGVAGEGVAGGWPVSGSHSRTVLRRRRRWPAVPVRGERHRRSPRRCGRSAGRRAAGRCRGSHSRTVWSSLAEASGARPGRTPPRSPRRCGR